jgi:cytochrome c peroxidase
MVLRALAATLLLATLSCVRPAAVSVTRSAAPGQPPPWEVENPLRPLPAVPLGSPADFARVPWVSAEKARLGRWLFYDRRLSGDGTVSCGTCHPPHRAYSEDEPVSTGIRGQKGKRKAPPIINVAFPLNPAFFWDGRASSLAEQAKGPIENPIEMGSSAAAATAVIAAVPGYAPYFREAFGDPQVTFDRIAEAIAAYEATRLSGNSRYDLFDEGKLYVFTPEEREGRDLFYGRARCKECHDGDNFTDSRFHNTGIGWRGARTGAPAIEGYGDKGRYEVTRDPKDVGAFKTPSLREVARHPPYMHDGSAADLTAAVQHYTRGGARNPWLSERMRPVPLTSEEVDALVAFLRTLDGEGWADAPPTLFPR